MSDYYDDSQWDDYDYSNTPVDNSFLADMPSINYGDVGAPNYNWYDSVISPGGDSSQALNLAGYSSGIIPQSDFSSYLQQLSEPVQSFDPSSINFGANQQFGAPDFTAFNSGAAFMPSSIQGLLPQRSAPVDIGTQSVIDNAGGQDVGGGMVQVDGNTYMTADDAAKAIGSGIRGPRMDPNEMLKQSPEMFRRFDSSGSYIPKTVSDYVTTTDGQWGYSPTHDQGGGMGVQETGQGLRSGGINVDGMMHGITVPGASNLLTDYHNARILGDEGVVEEWAKNKNSSWDDYALANQYDPNDIGTDLRWSLGNALPAAGYGGMGGKGKGAQLTPAVLDALVKAGGTGAGKGSSTGGASSGAKAAENALQKNGLASTPKDADGKGGAMGALNMAAMLAALLGGGDKKGPKSSQGDIGSNAWEVARMKSRGKAQKKASGGSIQGRGQSSGALGLLAGKQAGQADGVPIQASHGEYVMDADIVSALGDGNTEAGAAKLDHMREQVRAHKRSAPNNKIPPKAKSPLAYMKGAK